VPLAGKTGTTNEYFDAWFIGFTSDLAIGVYIGYDTPKSLGKFETGSKTALPIFKKFVESAIYKEEMKPFKIPKTFIFFLLIMIRAKLLVFPKPKRYPNLLKKIA
jgi:penicillin-binding protein 1A